MTPKGKLQKCDGVFGIMGRGPRKGRTNCIFSSETPRVLLFDTSLVPLCYLFATSLLPRICLRSPRGDLRFRGSEEVAKRSNSATIGAQEGR